MKLPYRTGDSFALPLGNGQFADSCIVHTDHRVATIAARGGGEAVAVLTCSDDAFVERRWKVRGRCDPPDAHGENARWMPSAHAERTVAARLGIDGARDRPLRAYEIADGLPLPRLDRTVMLALTRPLDAHTLQVLIEAIAAEPDVVIRVLAPAMDRLPALLAAGARRLEVAAPFDALPPSEHLRELRVSGARSAAPLVAAFPQLTALAWSGSAVFDASPLHALPALQTLSLEGCELRGALPALRALRLIRTTGMAHLDGVDVASLQTLALEHVHDLASVAALQRASHLEQLELRGMWQFEIRDVDFTLERSSLLRAALDIGGRRKSTEIYRHASWAYPWPFSSLLSGD